jgi:hypothetical protein
LGCTFRPSSIAIEFTQSSPQKQYQTLEIPFAKFTDPATLSERLITDHSAFFNTASIHPNKLKHFVFNIIQRAPEIDLRLVPKDELTRYKEQMNREFEANAIKPTDPRFQRDVRVDFGPATEPSDWD